MRIRIFNQIKIGIQIETKEKTRKEDHEANEMEMEKETKLKEKKTPLNGFRSSHWKVVFKSIKFIALDYNSFKCIK